MMGIIRLALLAAAALVVASPTLALEAPKSGYRVSAAGGYIEIAGESATKTCAPGADLLLGTDATGEVESPWSADFDLAECSAHLRQYDRFGEDPYFARPFGGFRFFTYNGHVLLKSVYGPTRGCPLEKDMFLEIVDRTDGTIRYKTDCLPQDTTGTSVSELPD